MPNFISEDQIEQAMVQRLQHLCVAMIRWTATRLIQMTWMTAQGARTSGK